MRKQLLYCHGLCLGDMNFILHLHVKLSLKLQLHNICVQYSHKTGMTWILWTVLILPWRLMAVIKIYPPKMFLLWELKYVTMHLGLFSTQLHILIIKKTGRQFIHDKCTCSNGNKLLNCCNKMVRGPNYCSSLQTRRILSSSSSSLSVYCIFWKAALVSSIFITHTLQPHRTISETWMWHIPSSLWTWKDLPKKIGSTA